MPAIELRPYFQSRLPLEGRLCEGGLVLTLSVSSGLEPPAPDLLGKQERRARECM